MKSIAIAAALFIPVFTPYSYAQSEKYKDTSLSFEERAADLVSRMTLEEKVNQMRYDAPAVERLNIPAHNWWNECLHGVARSGLATVFPQAIGMAAMWDSDFMHKIAVAISDEARAKHHRYVSEGKFRIYQGLTFWTPNINIFRDPRWGRGMETYGEDPYLTGELAVPFIKGLQGDDPTYLKVVTTAKHFTVHSGPESTRHSFDVYPSEKDFLETYTPHFKKTVQEGNVYSVMCAYQRFRGEPCCGSFFLDNLLRNEWGFDGYIVSDCEAIRDFYMKGHHEVVATKEEAAALGVKAGTDLNCGDTYRSLAKAVEDGYITEAELDVSVRRLMLARMKLGQFDPPEKVTYTKIPYSVVDSEEHQALALESARKSIVLLKNENNLLPLSKNLKNIAVIGPNANDMEIILANYNGYPSAPVTPLDGIRNKMKGANVTYSVGCPLAPNLPIFDVIPASVFYTDKTLKTQGLKAEYFDNTKFEGTPKHTRIDSNIDFEWGTNPPLPGLQYEAFSVRWEGVIVPPVTGEYAIGGEAFFGMELFLNDSLIISRSNIHHPRKEYEHLLLEAGKPYSIKINYRQNHTEHAMVRVFWEIPGKDLKKEALANAANAETIILCMGISPLLEGEDMKVKVEGFDGGDRIDIKIPEIQTNLMKDILKLGKPTVLVLFNGSALAVNWENENIPAIVEAWYPGQAAGTALADVLFGDYNPAGRLPLTFYKSIDQISAFDNYDMSGKTYRYFSGEPLYEFGHGLSYTTFTYSLTSLPKTVKAGDNITVTVEVANTGGKDGEEVVQLYTAHPQSKYNPPIRSLNGFERIFLKAGEKKKVTFNLSPAQIAVLNTANQWEIESAPLLISVGGKQPDAAALKNKTVVQGTVKVQGNKVLE